MMGDMSKLKITYYTRRWSQRVSLNVKKTSTGWHISHIAINGDTDPEGHPILERNLVQDNVHFPKDVGHFLGHVWYLLEEGVIDEARAQEMLEDIGQWISSCETSQPTWRGWNC